MNNEYDLYIFFGAIKTHFTDEKYDYFKYHGRTKLSVNSFNNCRSKKVYIYLYKKYSADQLKGLILSNILIDPKITINKIYGEEGYRNYLDFLKRTESLLYNFECEIKQLFESEKSFKELINTNILKHYYDKKISIETLLILNDIFKISEKIEDDILWFKVRKYKSFLSYDSNKVKKILKENVKKYYE